MGEGGLVELGEARKGTLGLPTIQSDPASHGHADGPCFEGDKLQRDFHLSTGCKKSNGVMVQVKEGEGPGEGRVHRQHPQGRKGRQELMARQMQELLKLLTRRGFELLRQPLHHPSGLLEQQPTRIGRIIHHMLQLGRTHGQDLSRFLQERLTREL